MDDTQTSWRVYGRLLCPESYMCLVFLHESRLSYDIVWEKSPYSENFLRLCRGFPPPIIQNKEKIIRGKHTLIYYFVYENSPIKHLLPPSQEKRIRMIEIIEWWMTAVSKQVFTPIIGLLSHRASPPHTTYKRWQSICTHVDARIGRDGYVCYERLSFADIVAACYIACLDYMGAMDWKKYAALKIWYSVIKSRPSFSKILHLKHPLRPPPPHFSLLDF